MTWAEFQLRLLAFNRQEEGKLLMIRRLGWLTHMTPKKGQNENGWWSIGKKIKRVSEDAKDRFKEEYKKYLKAKNG